MIWPLIALILSNLGAFTGPTSDRITHAQFDSQTSNHGGPLERRSYAYTRNQVTETDPLGTSRTYRYAQFRDMPYLTGVTQPCSACGSGSTVEQGYDARGFITSTRDFRGNRATYQRDARGLITVITKAVTPWSGTAAGGSQVLYIQPDHLDSPRVVVNALGQSIWRWDSSPFGDTDVQ